MKHKIAAIFDLVKLPTIKTNMQTRTEANEKQFKNNSHISKEPKLNPEVNREVCRNKE